MTKIDDSTIRPGTIGHAAIRALMSVSGDELSTTELAALIKRHPDNLSRKLRPAVEAELVARRQARDGRILWSVGPRYEEATKGTAPAPRSQVTVLSAEAATSVFAYGQARNAAPFSCALHTDGRLTAERFGRLIAEFSDGERQMLLNVAMRGVQPCS